MENKKIYFKILYKIIHINHNPNLLWAKLKVPAPEAIPDPQALSITLSIYIQLEI